MNNETSGMGEEDYGERSHCVESGMARRLNRCQVLLVGVLSLCLYVERVLSGAQIGCACSDGHQPNSVPSDYQSVITGSGNGRCNDTTEPVSCELTEFDSVVASAK